MKQGEALVPTIIATGIVAAMQILIAWFILGSEEVLLQLVPVTVTAMVAAEISSLVRLRHASRHAARIIRVSLSSTAIVVVIFCFVVAVAFSRSLEEPFVDAPLLTEWVLAVTAGATGYFCGRYIEKVPE